MIGIGETIFGSFECFFGKCSINQPTSQGS